MVRATRVFVSAVWGAFLGLACRLCGILLGLSVLAVYVLFVGVDVSYWFSGKGEALLSVLASQLLLRSFSLFLLLFLFLGGLGGSDCGVSSGVAVGCG